MKKIILTTIFITSLIFLQAQHISVTEGTKMMREGSFNSFNTELNDIKASNAEKAWEDYMKEFKAKTKRDKKQNLLISENVQIPNIGRNPVDVYAMIAEDKTGNSAVVNVWFDTGSGYVNSIDMGEQAMAASKIVEEYALDVLKAHALSNEKDQEKLLSDLESDLKKLEKKDDDIRKDIAKAKDNIQKWEKELSQNEDEQDKKKKAIRS